MEILLAYLVVAFLLVAAMGVVGYFVLRRLFMHAADRVAHHLGRALNELATMASSGRASRVSAVSARVATGHLTRLAVYAAAEGLSEEAARAQFQRGIERVARIMDSAIKLPLIGGVGLDALVGLVPVVGDAASAVVSVALIGRSIRYGIPREIITKMLANVLVDLLLGAVPLAGDLADMWFKSNVRNVALLKEYLGDEAVDDLTAAPKAR